MYKKCFAIVLVLFMLMCGCAKAPPEDAQLVSLKGNLEQFGLHDAAEYHNLSNDKKEWGMKKNKGSAPQVDGAAAELLQRYGGVYKTDEAKTLYLTFDEGYENGYTAQILDVLKKTGVPAAFFITGDYLKTQPELVKRMADEGHNVGNHTYKHPSMPSITDPKALASDILSLSQAYAELTGKQMTLLRPPMGEFSERSLAVTRDLGLKTVLWSFAYVDWQKDAVRGAQYAYDCIMPYIHDGAVILLHAVSKDNADALERVITDLQAQGYTFKAL